MSSLGRQVVSIYVDRVRHQWIVRDPKGTLWVVPSVEHAWDHREPLDPVTDESDLEPVPGHYKYMLDLPF
jgi:hypothetical protein